MPGKFSTWLLMLLLLVLLGMTTWMFWAVQKLDDGKRRGKHGAIPQSRWDQEAGH